ncbi:MAG: TolC family protein [Elusimicrobia bacterium]|nr:TolC family protein [Elusimicrobiota bacterium]
MRRLWLAAAIGLTCVPARAELSLEEALRLAVERSPRAQAARVRRDDLALEEPLLLSNQDPRLGASYGARNDRAPRAAPTFEGSRLQAERWETSLSQRTLLGSEAKLAWTNERITNPSLFRLLDPSASSRLSLELRQNLLRYFWGRPDVARRTRARRAVDAAAADLRSARASAAAQAAGAWLELRAARILVALREGGVRDARRLQARTEEKGRYGTAEDSELLQARASLEAAETELLLAQSGLRRARHALAAALREEGSPEGLVASTGPISGLPAEWSLPKDEAEALAKDAAVEAARRRAEQASWELRIARLDTLPELSVDASYTFAGLDSRYRGAFNDMGTWRHPVASAGASLVLPIGWWKERLTRRQAELRRQGAEAEAGLTESEARRAWRDARENLDLARRRLGAARTLSALEAKKLAAGEADFRRGRATTDLLVRFQQDKRRAEAELVRAETDEALALVELSRLAGLLGAE